MVKDIISRHCSGSFGANPLVLATTDANDYYPIYMHYTDDLIFESNGISNTRLELIGDVGVYNKPVNNAAKSIIQIEQYGAFFQKFNRSIRPSVYSFTKNDVAHSVSVLKGYIADSSDNILLCVATNDFMNPFGSSEEIVSDSNALYDEKTTVFVSHELANNEIYSNLYRKIKKEVIDHFLEKRMEVVYLSCEKIEKRLFKNNFDIQYNSLIELQDHLSSGLESYLHYEVPNSNSDDNIPF